MNEITREQFEHLENCVADCSIQKVTGELEVVNTPGGGKLYRNKGLMGKKWFRSMPEQGVWLADPKLIKRFLK